MVVGRAKSEKLLIEIETWKRLNPADLDTLLERTSVEYYTLIPALSLASNPVHPDKSFALRHADFSQHREAIVEESNWTFATGPK